MHLIVNVLHTRGCYLSHPLLTC